MRNLPDYLEGLGGGHQDEFDALSGTLLPFLESGQFDETVARAEQDSDPIEFSYFSTKKTPEGSLIRDFSESFHFPLQFEPTTDIALFTIRLSLPEDSNLFSIAIESLNGRTLYLFGAQHEIRRYEE